MSASVKTEIRNSIYISASGNCNFNYVTGLSQYPVDEMETALEHTFTKSNNGLDDWGRRLSPKDAKGPAYRGASGGMYLFAQDSDSNIEKKPYSRNYQKAIEEYGLGRVVDIGPVPNPLHGNRPGNLFVWIINHAACHEWWKKRVREPWEQAEAEKQEADLKAKAIKKA